MVKINTTTQQIPTEKTSKVIQKKSFNQTDKPQSKTFAQNIEKPLQTFANHSRIPEINSKNLSETITILPSKSESTKAFKKMSDHKPFNIKGKVEDNSSINSLLTSQNTDNKCVDLKKKISENGKQTHFPTKEKVEKDPRKKNKLLSSSEKSMPYNMNTVNDSQKKKPMLEKRIFNSFVPSTLISSTPHSTDAHLRQKQSTKTDTPPLTVKISLGEESKFPVKETANFTGSKGNKTENVIILRETVSPSKTVEKVTKDEDFRLPPLKILNQNANIDNHKRTCDNPDDQNEVPSKIQKLEDLDQHDFRSEEQPFLFGSKDQDLRREDHLGLNAKGWAQYKEAYPEEFQSPKLARESLEGKLRSRRFSSESNNSYDDRSGLHFQRERFQKMAVRRGYSPRGNRGRIKTSFMYPLNKDPETCIREAEEKYQNGSITKSEYLNLCNDLKALINGQECCYEAPMDTKLTQQFETTGVASTNISFKESARFHPEDEKVQELDVKTFKLDEEMRVIHFVNGRAYAVMDEDDHRELFFRSGPRNVFIKDLPNPIVLGFDGKPAEFEINGIKHAIRFGTPAREIYIDDHPFEAQFGGPPLNVLLDGQSLDIRIPGPPPQVIIGGKLPQDAVNKFHSKNLPGNVFELSNENVDSSNQHLSSSVNENIFPQDVDMRIKHQDTDQPIIDNVDIKNLDSDWRLIPSKTETNEKQNNADFEKDECLNNYIEKRTYTSTENCREKLNYDDEYLWRNRGNKTLINDDISEAEIYQEYPNSLDSSVDTHYKPQWAESQWHASNHDWRHNEYRAELQPCDRPVLLDDNPPPHPACNRPPGLFRQFQRRPFGYFGPPRLPYPPRHFHDHQMRGRPPGPRFKSWPTRSFRERVPPYRNMHPRHFSAIQSNRPFNAPPRALLPAPKFPPYTPRTSLVNTSQENVPTPLSTAYEHLPENNGTSVLHSTETVMAPPVDVESLLEKLIAAGIINSKPDEQRTQPIELMEEDKVKEIPVSANEIIPDIVFKPESLRAYYPGVVFALHAGAQCDSCGTRFKELKSENYSRHLDWHFRMNRREKAVTKNPSSRRWYFELEDWIQFEEFDDSEDKAPSFFELQAEDSQEQIKEVVVPSVPATEIENEECAVCGEPLQLFWVEDEEEWHLRNAVRHDKVVYHPACYEDFKKETESLKYSDIESAPNQDEKPPDENIAAVCNEEIAIFLNNLMSQISENKALDEEICRDSFCNDVRNKTEISEENISSSSQVLSPSQEEIMDINEGLESDILEGKPGEEEIIGIITESDVETDNNLETVDSKMVVMQSGGITLKVKAESLQQAPSPINMLGKDSTNTNFIEEEEEFRPPSPDPRFQQMPVVKKGKELSGLCSIM